MLRGVTGLPRGAPLLPSVPHHPSGDLPFPLSSVGTEALTEESPLAEEMSRLKAKSGVNQALFRHLKWNLSNCPWQLFLDPAALRGKIVFWATFFFSFISFLFLFLTSDAQASPFGTPGCPIGSVSVLKSSLLFV